jgi:glycosyltransferase involved in cell wall biosynthesis
MPETASKHEPLVGIVTPVYNGGPYIAECIESVLRQTYANWTFTISDNASTDDTVRIASEYAAKDGRIRVVTHDKFLTQMPNWNRSLEYFDRGAAYFKMLHADDWLYPDCLAEMVAVAEQHPSVGIVSAYRLEELTPSLGGIPFGQTVTPGRDVCRGVFSHTIFVFGSPSNILIRGDLVRKYSPFYDPSFFHADYEACLRLLQESDLGFVFKILTFTRRHNESHTSKYRVFNTYPSEDILIFKQYGSKCFGKEEFERAMKHRVRSHYRFLGKALLERRGKEFWKFQREMLAKAGFELSYPVVAYSAALALLNVKDTLRQVFRSVSSA